MKQNGIVHKFARFLVDNPKKLLVLSIIIIGAFAAGLPKLGADFSYRIWFRTTDPLIKTFDKFERTFGNDDSLVLLIHSPEGIFNTKTINLIKNATEKFWQVPDIIRVDSITNYQWTHADGDDVLVEDFISEDFDNKELNFKKTIALNHKVIPGYLINDDENVAMIYAKVKPFPGASPDDKKLIDNFRAAINTLENDGSYKFYINGSTAINNTFSEVSAQDGKIMIPAVFLLITLFLIFFFRSFAGVLIPYLVIIATMMMTFGYSGHFGIKFNNIIFMVPFVIMAIAIADSVHVLVTYYQYRGDGQNKYDATYNSFVKNITPTFLTSISTSIGFLSFSAADLIPLANFGWLAGFGTMAAWLLTMITVAPILAIAPIKARKSLKVKHENNLYEKLFYFIQKKKKPFFYGSLVLFVISIGVGLMNEVNSNPYAYFSDSVPLRRANDFGLKMLGGVTGPELVIDSGRSDGIKNSEFLNKVDKLQNWIEDKEYVNRVVSLGDIIKSMNKSFNADNEEFYRIPKNDKTIAELLFLYTMSLPQGMDINDRISLDNRSIRMSVLWSAQDSLSSLSYMQEFREYAKSIGLNAVITGKIPIYQGMNNLVVDTFFTSIFFAILGISLLLIIFFKSIKIGLLSMLPNVIPLGLGAALMTILSKPIDIGSALVTSVCLGIVVDDTIHFLANFHKYRNSGLSTNDAVKKVMINTGPALFTTSIILMVGFGILAFSSFVPNINFGILCSFILGIALVVDLTFLPAMLMIKEKDS